MFNVRSSGCHSDQAVSSRGESIQGEGLHRSSMGASAQAGSIISLGAVEEDESNCSCLTVMTEKVCALWTACYETVSPSITAFCNWVSNLFTGANQEAGQEAVGRMGDESALQRVYSAISIQIEKLFEFVRSNCLDETVVTLPHQESTRVVSEPAGVNPRIDVAARVAAGDLEPISAEVGVDGDVEVTAVQDLVAGVDGEV